MVPRLGEAQLAYAVRGLGTVTSVVNVTRPQRVRPLGHSTPLTGVTRLSACFASSSIHSQCLNRCFQHVSSLSLVVTWVREPKLGKQDAAKTRPERQGHSQHGKARRGRLGWRSGRRAYSPPHEAWGQVWRAGSAPLSTSPLRRDAPASQTPMLVYRSSTTSAPAVLLRQHRRVVEIVPARQAG